MCYDLTWIFFASTAGALVIAVLGVGLALALEVKQLLRSYK